MEALSKLKVRADEPPEHDRIEPNGKSRLIGSQWNRHSRLGPEFFNDRSRPFFNGDASETQDFNGIPVEASRNKFEDRKPSLQDQPGSPIELFESKLARLRDLQSQLKCNKDALVKFKSIFPKELIEQFLDEFKETICVDIDGIESNIQEASNSLAASSRGSGDDQALQALAGAYRDLFRLVDPNVVRKALDELFNVLRRIKIKQNELPVLNKITGTEWELCKTNLLETNQFLMDTEEAKTAQQNLVQGLRISAFIFQNSNFFNQQIPPLDSQVQNAIQETIFELEKNPHPDHLSMERSRRESVISFLLGTRRKLNQMLDMYNTHHFPSINFANKHDIYVLTH